MGFREALKSGRFVVTTDIVPPKGTDITPALMRLEALRGRVDAVNAVDMPSAVMRLGALATALLLKERGFEPILQMTCRDRNRLSLQSELLSAHVLGIHNILALGGDAIEMGDDARAKEVRDLDSVGLLTAARRLEVGYDLAGHELRGRPHFCLGAAIDPLAHPLADEITWMERKVEAGAEFFQTQPVYDVKSFAAFLKQVEHLEVPILAGVLLLKSAPMAHFMNEHVPGVNVPPSVIAEMEAATDRVACSVDIAAGTIQALRQMCAGVHIMTLHWEDKVPLVLEAAGL